jgi:hypothetical protein
MASERVTRIRAGRTRSAAFFTTVAAAGECFTWGDDEGVSPWEDRFGDTLVPVWPDELSAASENEADADPGERPLRLGQDDLAARLGRWKAADVGLAVHPVGGRIAGTYTVPEFVEQLLEATAGDEGAAGHRWRDALASLRRVLP